jgi:ribosomal protein S18 acetylase RimI-like enzyme
MTGPEFMTGRAFDIRPARASDLLFLTDMLVEAVNWHPQRNWDRDRILSDPDLAHYLTGWPGPGESGALAEAAGAPARTPAGTPVGAAWLRLLPASDPGYGFVAEGIPELTIGVVASWRRCGVGRALLRALAAQARSAGLAGISLSVERGNPARELYRQEGFRTVGGDEGADTMILLLTGGGSLRS